MKLHRSHTEEIEPTDETPETTEPATLRHALYRWYRTRPVWGCLLLGLGGWFVLRPLVGASFSFLSYLGVAGFQVYILGGGMIIAAVVALLAPSQRHFPALMAAIFSVAALPLANLGGWLLGTIFGIIGSGLIFAWTPYNDKQLAAIAAKAERKAERKRAGN